MAAGVGVLVLALLIAPAGACSLCDSNLQASPTFRQEAELPMAKLILHGTIANPRTTGGVTGQTDFHVKTVLRDDPAMKGKKTLVLPRFLPVNDKDNPPHYLLFCDVEGGKVDPYRGVLLKSSATVEYVKKALAMKAKDTPANLAFFFRYLDDADPEVARDAFLEFAKAGDADIARAAPKLDPAKLRGWVKDPKTPPQKLGVYALLLGACGQEADAALLRSLLDSKEERYVNAADGLLAGYMQKKPREGWAYAQAVLADGRRPLLLRLAVLRTLRFNHGSRPKESKPEIVKAMKSLLVQGELADLAVEDLRRWGIWDLTGDVLKAYGQKGFDSPLMKRAIIRYALTCTPTKETAAFLAGRRAAEADVVKDVEEGLKFEKAG
jgi:hypothetical protein